MYVARLEGTARFRLFSQKFSTILLPFGRKSTGPVGVAHTHIVHQGRGSRKAPDTSAQAVKKGQLGSGVPIDLSIG